MSARERDAHEAWRAVLNFAGTDAPLAVAARRVDAIADAAVEARTRLAVAMRAEGWSWAEIGDAFGLSRQGAQQRYSSVTN